MLGGRDRRRSDGQVHRCWVPALRTDSGTVSSLLPRDPRAVGRSDFGSAALCSELRSTRPATAPAVGHRCGILVRRSTSNGSGLAVTRRVPSDGRQLELFGPGPYAMVGCPRGRRRGWLKPFDTLLPTSRTRRWTWACASAIRGVMPSEGLPAECLIAKSPGFGVDSRLRRWIE